MAPGTTSLRADVGERQRAARAHHAADPAQPAAPEQRAERHEHGRREREPVRPGHLRPFSTSSGNVRAYQRMSVKSKIGAGVGGVVVGDDRDDAVGVRVARPAWTFHVERLGRSARVQ